MNPWISIKTAKLHALTCTWPAERRWAWGRDKKHGVTLTNPHTGARWKFHMAGGCKLRRIDEDEHGRA